MKDLTLTAPDQARLQILNHLSAGACTALEAACLLGHSVRQLGRLLAAYRRDGAAALVHGNRGRPPPHTASEPVRQPRARAGGCSRLLPAAPDDCGAPRGFRWRSPATATGSSSARAVRPRRWTNNATAYGSRPSSAAPSGLWRVSPSSRSPRWPRAAARGSGAPCRTASSAHCGSPVPARLPRPPCGSPRSAPAAMPVLAGRLPGPALPLDRSPPRSAWKAAAAAPSSPPSRATTPSASPVRRCSSGRVVRDGPTRTAGSRCRSGWMAVSSWWRMARRSPPDKFTGRLP
jgi:hypothetical protein